MFETPEIGWTSSESKQDEAKLDISNTQCRLEEGSGLKRPFGYYAYFATCK